MEVKYKYIHKFFATTLPNAEGWKQKVAQKLRAWASKLDGRTPIFISMESQPELTKDEHKEIIDFGIKQMEQAHINTVKTKAIENVMSQHFPTPSIVRVKQRGL